MNKAHNPQHRSARRRLGAFIALSIVLAAYLVVVTGNLRFDPVRPYRAMFANVSGLQSGNEVRIAGVQVGKVRAVSILPSSQVDVTFDVDTPIALSSTTTATVRYKNLVGDRYLELEPGTDPGTTLPQGATIPVDHTGGALDLDTLLNGFKPLFAGLQPDQVNQLSNELVQVLQGQASYVYSLIATLASFTSTIADRDALVGQVIDNLNTALGTFADRDTTLGRLIDQLSSLASGLAAQAPTITDAVTQIDAFASNATSLLASARPDITPTLTTLNALAASLNRNTDSIQQILDRLPSHYKTIARISSHGDFFNFFLCGVRLKLSDNNGNPVYTPWTKSEAVRCQ